MARFGNIRRLLFPSLCLALLAAAACADGDLPVPTPMLQPSLPTPPPSRPASMASPTPTAEPAPAPSGLKVGLVATFDVDGERFRVWVTNPFSVHAITRVHGGTSTAFIPNGRVREGPGQADYNAPWSWHLDPEDTGMDHFTAEVCNATPSQVERNLDHFVRVVGRYCPWRAELIHVEYLPPAER